MQKDFFRPKVINMPEGLEMIIGVKTKNAMRCPHCHQKTLLRPKMLTKDVLKPLKFAATRTSITAKDIKQRFDEVAYATFTQLKYWELIEKTGDTGNSWQITEHGRRFLNEEIRIPEYVWVYNDHARVVPPDMLGRWVCYSDLVPYVEVDRESVAAASLPIEVKTQDKLM